ncbi:MAG TPA: helix-turn-helix domain-containing protein [Gemmatimonadales bacterium]|nr:helix-turn-helix domain-containing protein [Gemmatimonadales bacterium]
MASLTLDWLHLVVLLGAVQGVLLAGVLVAKRSNRTANRLLASLMLAFSVALASEVYYSADLVRAWPHFFGLSYPLPFLYGPLVYLYAVTAADRSRRLTRWDALHFVPFLAVVIAGLPIYLMSGADKVAFFHQLRSGVHPPLIRIVDPLKYVSGVTYAALTIAFLRRHQGRVRESYSTVERVNLRWLLWLGAGAAAIWLLAVGVQVLETAGVARIARQDTYIALAIAVLVYGIGYAGLRQPEIFRYETAELPIPVLAPDAVPAPESAPEPEPGSAGPRYERSGLTGREAHHLKQALLAVMDRDRPWCDSELTLADLATRLSTTPHKLSEVLNSELGQSFYDFVNGHRVREVQRRIAAGEAGRVTILSLALEAGFASKSTFNLVFKKLTGQTPSDYRQTAGA